MDDFLTINQTIKTGMIPSGLLRRMIRENRCPGVYSGTRFYVNIPLLHAQLVQESQTELKNVTKK